MPWGGHQWSLLRKALLLVGLKAPCARRLFALLSLHHRDRVHNSLGGGIFDDA